ncbi:MAG: DNA mismatch repair endonuclease MutL [Candidatus Izemoplasmatales bacterium]
MGNIIRLDEHLANMIAAGEVIERPTNVVKELTENAIDANSTAIEIELKGAGMDMIRVTDNGAGMDESDANNAFERHATSKIKTEYDLFRIQSLGFRGEALPSIAAIAKIELTTSIGNNQGYKIVFQAGKKVDSGIAQARKGTDITVTKLFYNTPARLKYLKDPNYELAIITELIDKFALAHPKIAFTLINNEKVLFKSSGSGNVLEVLGSIYGYNVAKQMKPFNNDAHDYRISGYIANPLINRSSRNCITLITNGRVIKNPKVISAVNMAFDQRIPKGRYPIALINITCDPLLIDVNIHPTKQEIKFSEEAKLFNQLTNIVKMTINQFVMIQESDNLIMGKETDTVQNQLHFNNNNPITDFDSPMNDSLLEISEKMPEKAFSVLNQSRIPDMEYIGQFAGTYLLFQNQEGLFLIDQHAAAERIRYENYIKRMSNPKRSYYDLLVPFNVDFSNHDAIQISDHLSEITDFGITLTPSGTQSFFINSVPTWFPLGMEEAYTEEVIKLVLNHFDLSVTSVRDELAKRLACKHSIKANHFINQDEIQTMMRELNQCLNPHTCPHGRPIIVKITLYEIEKMFKRVM